MFSVLLVDQWYHPAQPDSVQLGDIPRIAFHTAATTLANSVAGSAHGGPVLRHRLPHL